MKTEAKKNWITALRSGNYKQAKGELTKDGGYCCLGVNCLVNASDIGYFTENGIFVSDEDASIGADAVTPLFVAAALEMVEENPTISIGLLNEEQRMRAGEHPFGIVTLSALNDMSFTFTEIADLLEEKRYLNNTLNNNKFKNYKTMKTTDKIFYIANKNGANVHVTDDTLGDYLSEHGQEVCTSIGREPMFEVIKLEPDTTAYDSACKTLDIDIYDEDGQELDDYSIHTVFEVVQNNEHGNPEIRLTTTDEAEADEEYCRLAVLFLNDDDSMIFFDEAETEQSFADNYGA